MKISSAYISNFRCFKSVYAEFTDINVFVGANNSGKSSVLKALAAFQSGLEVVSNDIRSGSDRCSLRFKLLGVPFPFFWKINGSTENSVSVSVDREPNYKYDIKFNGNSEESLIPTDSDKFVFIPFLSRRRGYGYEEQVKRDQVDKMPRNFNNLVSRLSVIINDGHPRCDYYKNACRRILGFALGLIPSVNGQQPGIYISEKNSIGVEQMGEGVAHIAALIESLAVAENKIFLIEELENDLHPAALKELLALMVESSRERGNQFFVTTHSNIVVRHLCSLESSSLFHVESVNLDSRIPTSEVRKVPDDPESRLAVLQDLGYSPSDYMMWDGWIFFEESSAERIVRQFIIPWFFPKLMNVRIFSAAGVNQIAKKLSNFQDLITYAHLEPVYKNRAWVFVDGDKAGRDVVCELREKFKNWPEDRFTSFSNDNFEDYYPVEFSSQVNEIFSLVGKDSRREPKKKLLNNVVAWLIEDEERGRAALKNSAAEIINQISLIEKSLLKTSLVNSNGTS